MRSFSQRKYVGRWSMVRLKVKRPKWFIKKLSIIAIGAFVLTLYLVFKTVKLENKAAGIHRLNFEQLFYHQTRDPFIVKYQEKRRMPPSIEDLERDANNSYTSEFILTYYLKDDGVQIKWLRNNNTRNLLDSSLEDSSLMMVDVDVIAGVDKISKNMSAVVAKSNNTDDKYELELEKLLKYLAIYSNKGVQLNIESLETLKLTLQTVKALRSVLHSPIWLGINVLHGPNGKKEPIDLLKAVELVQEYYPHITLSLGWVTHWSSEPVETGYSWSEVVKMAKLCLKFKQRVSFSVRAVYVRSSLNQIKWLLSLSSRFSITIWTEKYDIFSMADLISLRKQTDKRKVFYNLPKHFIDKITSTETVIKFDRNGKWDRSLWRPALLDENSLAFLGEDHAVLEGDNSWLVSKTPHRPGMLNRKSIQIHGNVQFIESPTKEKNIPKFSLFLRCSGVNPPKANDVHGIRMVIMRDGIVTLSSQNLIEAGKYKPQTMAKLPSNDCVSFKVIDSGEEEPILCTVSVINCETGSMVDKNSEVSLHLRVPYDGSRQMFYIAVTGGTEENEIVLGNLVIS